MAADDDLRWRLDLLKQALEENKISFAPHLLSEMRASLDAVRVESDGLVDLSTVDGRIRSMALAVAGFHHRDETKNLISLQEIQQRYFTFIEATFGEIYQTMIERGAHAQSMSWALSKHSGTVTQIQKIINPFIENLADFWSYAGESCEYHLQDVKRLKGVFGGDLFPSYTRNIASTSGLYLDTIILTDPFMNSRRMFEIWDTQTSVRFFVKHGLNVLTYKSLALSDINPPIVAIVPFRSSLDDEEADQVMQISEPDTIKHGSTLFGRDFSGIEELREFAAHLDTTEKAVAAIKRADRFLVDTEWKGSIAEQLVRVAAEQFSTIGNGNPGLFLFGQCTGRMRQATDILLKSRNLLGTPLISAETSWRYLNWKLEYDAALTPYELLPLHVVRGLQRVGETDIEWIGNIPPDALIEMRREGAMDEIRAMISNGVEEVADANPNNFFRSADQIVDNIQNAFAKHQENVQTVRAKGLKFWGQDVGSWVVKGSIEIGAALAGTPAMGLAALGVDQLLDGPKLKELPSRFRELRIAQAQHAKSPMGIFFKHQA